MVSKGLLLVLGLGALSLTLAGQNAPRMALVPKDPLELVTGDVAAVRLPADRTVAMQLASRARSNYSLRSSGHAYDVKVTFTVNSGGQTEGDGTWEMEDIFDPKLGLRWTAKGPNSYEITRISVKGMLYGDDTGSYVPLRLHEARAALYDPMPTAANVGRSAIRTAKASFNGKELTCVLVANAGVSQSPASGRRWDETEECIDPESGLLQVHSQVPGRYYAYDYTDATTIAGRLFPRKVIITEGGRAVTEINVESVTEIPEADPNLFVPTDEMKARGHAITLAQAQKVWRGPSTPLPAGRQLDAICVFGLVTPAGELVDAHSLQPANPNSRAAVEAARQMTIPPPSFGPQPEQHFVFIIQELAAAE